MAGHLGLELPKSMKFAYCVAVNFPTSRSQTVGLT